MLKYVPYVGKIPTFSIKDIMKEDLLLKIYQQPGTVFTVDEISQFFPGITYKQLKDRLYYFVKVGKLKRPKTGIYAKERYNTMELANKLYKPSYVSLETVLFKGAVVFQYYETIFLASYLTRSVQIGDINIQYRRLRGDILTNPVGIEFKEGYFIATLERAFLDAVYIYKNYYFDNLGSLNWEKINDLKKIYESKAFEANVEKYYKWYQEDYGKS